MRRVLLSLLVLIVITVAIITEFILCATMLLLALDTHNKFTLLCTLFCVAISIWMSKDMVYVYPCTFKKIKEYFSFRFQKDKDGFEKEEYCKPEKKTADKYKKGE